MATVTVSTAAQLSAALASAQAGDTILLNAGTYSGVVVQNINFSSAVTITSADASHPATLTDLMVKNSSGLNFTNLELDASHAPADWPFAVYYSNHIEFSGLLVHGSLDGNPQNDVSGLIIRNSSYVSVANSEFQQLKTAVAFLDDEHLSITGSKFHDLALDGVHGGGCSYVTISGNSFTDFFVADGDHPDAIQLWTTNTTSSAHDIVITDNLITRGAGSPMQGIFITDQVGTLPYIHVVISGNMLVGTRYHGITVQHGADVSISNNTVASYPDMKSWIRLENVDGASVVHNTAGELTQVNDLNIYVSDFTTSLPTIEQAQQMLQVWLAAHPGFLTGVTSDPAPDPTPPAVDTSSPDVLINGTNVADKLSASGNGVVWVHGLDGNDVLTGGAGNHSLFGDLGNDTFIVSDNATKVLENLGGGNDTVRATIDYTLSDNVENLVLLSGAHFGTGNGLDNAITGNNDSDTLSGLSGNDVINAGSGDDLLYGGAGDDRLIGGSGNDILYGGTGNDTFVYSVTDLTTRKGSYVDTIMDFATGDKIDLSAIDAASRARGNNEFTFIGNAEFTGVAGQLHYYTDGSHTYVCGDVNGDKVADFTICLDGLHALSGTDFVL